MAPTRVILMSCGSYNPPTNMHLRMFEIARDHLHKMGTCVVIGGVISPTHDAYGKKELASATHRCAMLRLALQNNDWIRLSTWETRQNSWTRTRASLQYHQNLLNSVVCDTNEIKNLEIQDLEWIPENVKNNWDQSPIQIKLLCGADLLESFGTYGLWLEEDIDAIVGQYGLIVITREGSNPNKFIYDSDILSKYSYNIIIVTEWISNEISSTRIRRALKRSESIRYLIQDSVIDYIYKNEIYDAKTPTQTIELELTSPNANNYLNLASKYSSTFLTPSPSDVTMESPSPIEVLSIDVPDSVLRKNLQNATSVPFTGLINVLAENGKHVVQRSTYPGQAKQIIATETGESQILQEVGLAEGELQLASCSHDPECKFQISAASYSVVSVHVEGEPRKEFSQLSVDLVQENRQDSKKDNTVYEVICVREDQNKDQNKSLETNIEIKEIFPTNLECKDSSEIPEEKKGSPEANSAMKDSLNEEDQKEISTDQETQNNKSKEDINEKQYTSVGAQAELDTDLTIKREYENSDEYFLVKCDSNIEIDGKYLKSVVNARKSPRKTAKTEQIYIYDIANQPEQVLDHAASRETSQNAKSFQLGVSGKKVYPAKPTRREFRSEEYLENKEKKKFSTVEDIPLKGSLDSVINASDFIVLPRNKDATKEAFSKKSKSYESIKRLEEVFVDDLSTAESKFTTADEIQTDEFCSICCYANELTYASRPNLSGDGNQDTFYTLRSACSSLGDEDSTECDICNSWTLQEQMEAQNQAVLSTDNVCEICEICGELGAAYSPEDVKSTFIPIHETQPDLIAEYETKANFSSVQDKKSAFVPPQEGKAHFVPVQDTKSDHKFENEIKSSASIPEDERKSSTIVTEQEYISDSFLRGNDIKKEPTLEKISQVIETISTEPIIDSVIEDRFEIENVGARSPEDKTNGTPVARVRKEFTKSIYPSPAPRERSRNRHLQSKHRDEETSVIGSRRVSRKGSLVRKRNDELSVHEKRRYSSADNLQTANVFNKSTDKISRLRTTKTGSADNIRTSKSSRRCKSLQRTSKSVSYLDSSSADNLDSLIECLDKEDDDTDNQAGRDNETVKMILTKHGIKIISEKETAL